MSTSAPAAPVASAPAQTSAGPAASQWRAMAVVGVLHAVGLVGIALPAFRPLILPLSALTLLITCGLVYASLKAPLQRHKIAAAAIIIAIGFFVELLGTRTGFPFGSYAYGTQLGPRLWGVPLIIGINWLLLSLCTTGLAQRLPWPMAAKVLAAAAMMTTLDALIEPVAPRLDYWAFSGSGPAWPNFAGWFVTSCATCWLCFKVAMAPPWRLAAVVYFIQALFFAGLNLLI